MELHDHLRRTLMKQSSSDELPAGHKVDLAELQKEVAISSHTQALKRFAMMESMMQSNKNLLSLKPSSSSSSNPSNKSVSLHGLLPITLPELCLGRVHTGRVLFGTLCTDAFSITGVMSVLLGANTACPSQHPVYAVRLAIYNAAMSSDKISDVQARFPKGMSVAIKEPFLKRAADGLLLLRVDNPGNMEKVSSHNAPCIPPPPPPPPLPSGVDALELRQMGNRLFVKEDWKSAIHCYTQCITLIQDKLRDDQSKDVVELVAHDVDARISNCNNSTTEEVNMMAVVFSNRAEAWMKLKKYDQALRDSHAALSVDPSHVKSLFRKGRALHGLGRFEHACSCFEMVLSLSPDGAPDVRDFLDASKQSLAETSSNILAGYSDFLLGKSIPPMLHDYIGPVVIKETKNKSAGRGLFATRSVKRGSLLVVSNAMAVCREDSKHFAIHLDHDSNRINRTSEENLVTKLVSLGMESPKHLHQLYALYSSESSSFSSMDAHSMDLFSDSTETEETPQIDLTRIRDIVRFNSFTTNQVSTMDYALTTPRQDSSGLWLLPSFINHSCIPNAVWSILGDSMVIHASSDLSSGDEITIPYFDTLIPLKVREKICSNWGFVCGCNRCVFEKSVEVEMEDKVRRFEYLYNQATDEYMSFVSSKLMSKKKTVHPDATFPACSMTSKLYTMISQHVEEMGHLTEVQKKWVLGGFSHAFLAKYFLTWRAYKFDTPMYRSAAKMLEALSMCEPGSAITVALAARLYTVAMEARKPKHSGSFLSDEWKHYCAAHFGEQKDGVWEKLLSRVAKSMPAFFRSIGNEGMPLFS